MSRRTQDPIRLPSDFGYRAFTFFGRAFDPVLLSSVLSLSWSYYPIPWDGLGFSPFARRYSGNHCCFLFLRLLRCFSSPGTSSQAMYSPVDDSSCLLPGSPIRTPALRRFLTAPRSFSQFGASFFSFEWPGIRRTPFLT